MNSLVRVLPMCALLFLHGCQLSTGDDPKASARAQGDFSEITAESLKALTKKVADWQIEHFDEQGKYRALPRNPPEWANREPYHDLEWQNGALYAGMNQWRKIADDPKYTQWLMEIGERNNWKLHRRPYHADDHTVGQFYLALYEDFKEPRMLNPVRDQFDWILENRKTGTLDWEAENTHAHDRWGWCDALFMAPPVWARLAKVTGDQKYLEFMDQEYHATYDLLWSEKDHLFWRDSTYFDQKEKNGEDIFWARGNGWVFGGLALMIPDLPQNWEGRAFYLDIYKKMARRLKEIQRTDGTWSMGLLGGTEGYPIRETSGTSFFTFGLAWGINQGILDRETYEPVVLRAWQALSDSVTEEGLLGYVQPVGAAPGDSFPNYTEAYGVGAFLAAGSELYKMLSNQAQERTEPESSHRFNTPTENLITGGQPSLTELKELKNAGVTKVINLRAADEDVAFNEQTEAEALGLEYVSLPISGAADVTSENARKLHELLEGDEKVFLHCASGNRVGALLAIRAHEIGGKPVDESLQFGRAAGLGSLEGRVKSILGEGH